MPKLSAIDAISVAMEHTKQQLFRPFRWGQWLRLALLGLMTGELSSGGGCSSGNSSGFPTNTQGGGQGFPSLPHLDPRLIAHVFLFVGIALLVFSVIVLVWMYVGSVCRFILIESIVTKRVSLRAGWHKWHATGLRYFWWRLVFQMAGGALFVILIGIPAGLGMLMGWFNDPKAHLGPILLAAIPLVILLLVVSLAAAVIAVLGKDFMAPIMALEDLNFADSWSRLLTMMNREKGSYAGYIGMKIVLAIASGILFGILIVIAFLVLLLPVVLVVVVATVRLTWNPYTITLAIVAGTMFFAFLMFLVSMLSVPVTVYFPTYSIYFFAARYPKLSAWLYPAPPAPVVPKPPVIEPPPVLPPSLGPEPIT